MTERPQRRNEALRENWFSAAYDILATEGYGGLKLAPLCKRLGVTTGSFYHSFDNWQDFTDALLDAWLQERTERTVAIVSEESDPVARLQLLLEASTSLMHRTEAAIRVWAGVDPKVAAVQRKVDEGRYAVVHEAMSAIVGPEQAEHYTVWGVSTLVGYEMVSDAHDREHLTWSLGEILATARRHARKK